MVRSKAYEVLGLNSSASIEEIKAAYAELSKKYHPEENPEEFQQIHEAYITLTRQTRNRNRILQSINMSVDVVEEFNHNSIRDDSKEEESFDFSNVDYAKKEDYERKLQLAIKELDGMTYADKNSELYVNNYKLKKFFNTQDTEILYSDEIIDKLILLLQQSLVNGETVHTMKAYIRSWDTGLADKRESLNRLKDVLEKCNRYYFKKHILMHDKNIVPYICWAIIGILLLIGIATNFILVIKCLVALLVIAGILSISYIICDIVTSGRVATVISSIVGFIILLIGYFFEVWEWFPELPNASYLYERFMHIWIAVIAGTLYRMMRGK